ncbi:hypothetical protein KO02_10830 [Sphingobacterium sp. ML3W]|uniref:RNA polymerase sigma factor n=1 Tax=Sphingobacterium sp. ML3W TaxID=1538644 RepID=UPI0004F81F59|nr:RNA polymerase sigma factor [Sphingobacterium sp. ML3W]AIM37129.1 hypothetical protein KO02_10830 [Sphingobacterium sp. ML3W]
MKNIDLNVLFHEKRQILNHFASQFTSDYNEKEDLIQDTLIKALKSIDHFRDDPNLMTWLYVIMKNTYINHYRHEKRQTALYEDYAMADYSNNTENNATEDKLLGADIQKAMDSLLPENAEIFRLYLEGYKYHEIAEFFTYPEGTIKSRIHLARKMLQKKLKMYQDN